MNLLQYCSAEGGTSKVLPLFNNIWASSHPPCSTNPDNSKVFRTNTSPGMPPDTPGQCLALNEVFESATLRGGIRPYCSASVLGGAERQQDVIAGPGRSGGKTPTALRLKPSTAKARTKTPSARIPSRARQLDPTRWLSRPRDSFGITGIVKIKPSSTTIAIGPSMLSTTRASCWPPLTRCSSCKLIEGGI